MDDQQKKLDLKVRYMLGQWWWVIYLDGEKYQRSQSFFDSEKECRIDGDRQINWIKEEVLD